MGAHAAAGRAVAQLEPVDEPTQAAGAPKGEVFKEENILVNGMILKGTLCPYFSRCLLAADGNCPQNIEVDFSCAMARSFVDYDNDPEIVLQQNDDVAYEAWLKSTPEYWSDLTNEITAKTINSGGKDRFGCKGEIERCGISCSHKKDVHDCKICSPYVAFSCSPLCQKCMAKGRDTCVCK